MVKTARHPVGIVRQGPMRLVIGAAILVSIAASGFAFGRATSDRQAAAINGGSLSMGAVHPERATILYHRRRPAQESDTAIHGRHNHHPMAASVRIFTPEQAIKDCQIHRLPRC
jgi:hypothetical protein